MAYRLQLRLDAATTCAAEVIKGTVVVDVSASTGQGRLPDRPIAVRVLVYGDESHSDGISVEHLKLLSTVAGDRAANEEAQTAALLCDAAAFNTAQTRANPLPGVPMDTHYGRGYYGDDAGVRRQQQHQPEPGGYLQPSDLASTPQQASRPPSPPAAHTTAPTTPAADSQHAPLAPPPQSWVPGGHYEYPFALQLPPWLPPSYYYEPRDNEADARLRYVVCAFVATAASSKAATADPGSTRVLVTKTADDKASASRRRSGVGSSSSKGSEAPDSPLKGKKGPAAVAATTAATEVPAGTTTKLSLPTQAKQLLRVLAREQVKELVVLSVFPQREFLQCLERVAIKPRFAHRLVFHVYKNSLTLSGFAKAPVTDINVRVSYDSSAAVVLCGRPQAMEHVRAALGVQGGGAPVGLTVTGTVVSPDGETGAVVQGGLTAQQTHGALDGMLRLRVKVTAGSVSVSKVRVELCQRVRFAGSSSAQQCDTYTLASYTHKSKIRAEETATFEARLELPKAFRHTRQDNNKLLPPTGITTAGIRTSTWLQVTFPDLDAVPEKVMEENVVMMAEGVDFSDTVPFLPHAYRAAPRAPTSRSRKVV